MLILLRLLGNVFFVLIRGRRILNGHFSSGKLFGLGHCVFVFFHMISLFAW
jgi:hypothetical protein